MSILGLILLLVFFWSFLPVGSTLSLNSDSASTSQDQVRSYHLAVTTRYQNLTSSYQGVLELALNTTGFRTQEGRLTWNLTWDEGRTWSTDSVMQTYAWNRSYQFAGLLLYTGWWIHPGIQLGDQIRIDGDAPATNSLLRTAPFTVTDLVSIQVQEAYYHCWQLSYASSQPQYETYYYESHTGILLRATSLLYEGQILIHEVNLYLLTSSPPLPTIHLFLHYWTNHYPLVLALTGATLVTLLVYHLIHYFNPPTTRPPTGARHNA